MDSAEFHQVCEEAASRITICPEFMSLLQLAAREKYLEVVIVTSGLRRIWEMVLKRENLSDTIAIIGGGCLADAYVV
jgi:peroxiredoxin family protein